MSFFPYLVCALLEVDYVRGGFAEGNKILIFETYSCHTVIA